MSRRLCQGTLLVVSVLAFCIAASQGVGAQQSQLSQKILEPGCSQPSSCEMQPPTISAVNNNANKPIITGTYDPVFSKYLRVSLGDRTYTLGIDGQLTAAGGEWKLDLSSLSLPLTPGAYEVIVETEGYDGSIERVSTIVILAPVLGPGIVKPDTPAPETPNKEPQPSGPDDRPKPMDPEEARVKVSLIPLIATVVASAVLFSFFAATRRKGEDEASKL